MDNNVIITLDKDAEYMYKKLIEEYQRWGLKAEYLNIGSEIQNMKIESNIALKGTTALGSIFTNSRKMQRSSVKTEFSKPGKQQEH